MKYIILFITVCFIAITAQAGDVYDAEKELFYTAVRDKCIVSGKPIAIDIGDALANGTAINRDFSHVLASQQFGEEYFPTPVELAYAFYLIAERIGNPGAKQKMDWLYPYMDPGSVEIIKTIIYRKYSNRYLRKCFAIEKVKAPQTPDVTEQKEASEDGAKTKAGMTEEDFYRMYIMDNGQ